MAHDIVDTTLLAYIQGTRFDDFQLDLILYNRDFDDFKDELYGSGDKFDSIWQLEEVFKLQQAFYAHTGRYLVFPIAGRFIWEGATDKDCTWCSPTHEGFDTYLAGLINTYELELKKEDDGTE